MTEPVPSPSPITLDRWSRERWVTASRYYIVEVIQDLFGVWLVKRSWGSLRNQRGNSLSTPAESYEHACALLTEIEKRRTARGYVRVG
jgi:hypothetical protein